tara:strand:+ start:683 stop:1234 length:552 start_codon:yes stop_codon:yes gene_type:complete
MFNLITNSPLEEKILLLISEPILALKFEIVRVSYSVNNLPKLQILIEGTNGKIEISDCAKISTIISTILDVEDPIETEYTLEVSSPGINRPLTRIKDIKKWAGYNIKLKTFEEIGGRNEFFGMLDGLEKNELLLEIKQGIIGIELDWIEEIKLNLTNKQILESAKTSSPVHEQDFDRIETTFL